MAKPKIVVSDINNVSIDGAGAGSITDILDNRKDVNKSDLLDALSAWKDARKAERDDALKAKDDGHAASLADRQARHDAELAARGQALRDAVAAVQAQGAQAVAALQAQYDATIAGQRGQAEADKARIKALEAEVAEQKNLVNALGGTELGRKMQDDARRRELLALRDQADALLAELDGVKS